jgi:2-methylcitrate dehydratase PrpD
VRIWAPKHAARLSGDGRRRGHGAAAASAKIMGLGIEETVNTLGLAAMFASGFGAGF